MSSKLAKLSKFLIRIAPALAFGGIASALIFGESEIPDCLKQELHDN